MTLGSAVGGVLCVLISCSQLSAQIAGEKPSLDPDQHLSQFVLETWGREDGLPTRQIRDIAQTPDGYLWLATATGLVRFDGVRFTVLSSHQTAAFASDDLLALETTRDGSLWIGSGGGGLVRLGAGEEPAAWGVEDGLAHLSVNALFEDRHGVLWIGTGRGVSRFADGRLETPAWPAALAHADVRAIRGDGEDRLFFGTYRNGVLVLEAGELTSLGLSAAVAPELERLGVLRQELDRVLALELDHDGVLWVGTGGALLRHGTSGLELFPELEPGDVWSLLVDRAGSVWFDSDGVGRWTGAKTASLDTAAGLPDFRVRALYEDHAGHLWIGTYNGGLARLSQGRFVPFGPPEGLPAQSLTCVFEDSIAQLWLGTHKAGLHRREENGRITSFGLDDGLPSTTVWSVAEDAARPGELWIGTDRGLARLSEGRIEDLTTRLGRREREASNYRVVYADPLHPGILWLGTRAHGVVRLSLDGEAFSHREITGWDGLPHDHVRLFHRDREGALWIGTEGGLARLIEERLEIVNTADVSAIHEDAAGTLWLVTNGNGLLRYDGSGFSSFTLREGLPQNHLWSVLEDDLERLWMSSNEGVFVVDKAAFGALEAGRMATLPVLAHGAADGMRTIECNGWGFPDAWRDRAGRFWYPTMSGAVTADPAPPRRQPPSVVIEEITSDRHEVDLPVAGGILAFPAGRHAFEVRYTALGLDDPERLRFRHRLDGFDEDWIDVGDRRVAYYTNLPPGQYAFRVSAAHREGEWNPQEARLEFAVAPFFYETWPFRVAAGALLVTLLLGAARWRSRLTAAAHRELETRVEERTVELSRAREEAEEAARVKAQFLANMSHEIRTPLAGVLGMIDLLDKTALDAGQRGYLDMARGASRTLLTLIDDILDLSKVEAGRLDLMRVVCEPRRLIAEVLALFEARAREKGLELAAEIDDSVAVAILADPVRLRQILGNLIGNAVKFTHRGSVRLAVRLRDVSGMEPKLRFEIHDTGIGIDPRLASRIFNAFVQADGSSATSYAGTGLGLAICRQLVERMGGEIGVSSTLGEGSIFYFTLPFEEAETVESPTRDPASEPLRLTGLVLLVEDNPVNRQVGRVMLESLGLAVDLADDGYEALKALEVEDYDLVLMDCRMPGLDGFEATRRIRDGERQRGDGRLPIVALTANAMPEDRERCLAVGMDEHVAKPFTAEGLAEVLRRFLEGGSREAQRSP